MYTIFKQLTIAFGLTACAMAVPSEATQSGQAKGGELRIRTLCAAYQGNIKEVEILQGKEDRIKLPLYDDAFSPPLNYKGGLPISLYQVGSEKPFARVSLSASAKDIILLFVPSKQEEGVPYRVLSMNGSRSGFSYGMRRMFNFTKNEIVIKYGDTKKSVHKIPVSVKPRDITITAAQTGSERFAIEFFQQAGKEWNRFSATRWTADPTKRSVVIFYQNPRTGRPTYKSIAEYKVEEALVRNAYERGKKEEGDSAGVGASEEKESARPANDGKGKTTPPIAVPTNPKS